LLVDSQQIETFTGVIEPIKLFLNNEQFFAQRVRLIGKPLLQVIPFCKPNSVKLTAFNLVMRFVA